MTGIRTLVLAVVIGIGGPAIFLLYPYDETYWAEWVLEPFTYSSVVFVFLLYVVSGGILKLLWLRGTGSRSSSVGIPMVIVILFSLPLVLVFWLATFSDYFPSPYEQVPRQIAVFNPLLSALIGSWIGGVLTRKTAQKLGTSRKSGHIGGP